MLHPSPFIALTRRSTVEDYAIARTISYDNETGVLAFEVLGVTGNGGPHSDWDIAALAASVPASLMMLEEVRTLRQQVADDVGDFEGLKEAVEADREAVDQARTDVGNIRTEVEQARDDAQGHLDTFLQVYRGALSAPPAGGQIGHFYFDTTDQQARVYTESGWSPLFSVALGGIRQGHHVATNGQTEFVVDGGFTFLNVFKNGSLLEPGADYTHDSPTFTLTSGAAAGDVVAYLAYRQIDEVDFYTKADADARYLHVGQLDGGTY